MIVEMPTPTVLMEDNTRSGISFNLEVAGTTSRTRIRISTCTPGPTETYIPPAIQVCNQFINLLFIFGNYYVEILSFLASLRFSIFFPPSLDFLDSRTPPPPPPAANVAFQIILQCSISSKLVQLEHQLYPTMAIFIPSGPLVMMEVILWTLTVVRADE